jgi:hypothetical protein
MKKLKLLFIVFAVIISSLFCASNSGTGDVENPPVDDAPSDTGVPEDFTITYHYNDGGMRMPVFDYRVMINREMGLYHCKWILRDETVEREEEFEVGDEEITKIHKTVVDNNFFQLKDEYEEIIYDGAYYELTVIADGREKSVSGQLLPEAFRNIADEVNRILREKIPDYDEVLIESYAE